MSAVDAMLVLVIGGAVFVVAGGRVHDWLVGRSPEARAGLERAKRLARSSDWLEDQVRAWEGQFNDPHSVALAGLFADGDEL